MDSFTETLRVTDAGQGHNQLARTLLSLCALTTRHVRLRDLVNDNPKPKPGLGPGGLTVAYALAQITNAYLKAELGDSDLDFRPNELRADDYHFDLSGLHKSAAPVSWVAEAIILPLSAANEESQAYLVGGTHVLGGPTTDYLRLVLLPMLGRLGFKLHFTEVSSGFYPQGGGEAELTVEPITHCLPLNVNQTFQPQKVGIEVVSAGLPVHLAEQLLDGALARLELRGFSPQTRLRRSQSGQGQALLIWAEDAEGLRTGFSVLGRRGERPEALANQAAENFMTFLQSNAALPADLAAWLLAPLAAAQGNSHFTVDRLSAQLKAAAQAVEVLWPGTLRLNELETGGPWLLRINGRDLGRAL